METDCREAQLTFQGLGRRTVVADFSAGRLSSDAGGLLLLREVAERSGLLWRFAQCFRDHRTPALLEHTVAELLAQRVLAQACGYEDLLVVQCARVGDDPPRPVPVRAEPVH